MDTKLQQFVRQIETLADVRNADPINPITFDYDVPGLSRRYRVAGSISEPTANAHPINLLWVVTDADSVYFRRVLQLKSAEPDDVSIAGRITGSDFLGTWVEITSFRDLFTHPQYYAFSGAGSRGPQGPAGEPGYFLTGQWTSGTEYNIREAVSHNGSSYYATLDGVTSEPSITNSDWSLIAAKGEDAEIDHERIIREAVERLRLRPISMEFADLPASVFEGESFNYRLIVSYERGFFREVHNIGATVVGDPEGVVEAADGNGQALLVNADTPVVLNAEFFDSQFLDTEPLTAVGNILVRDLRPVSLAVSGPNRVNENTTGHQYTATVTFSNGSTRVIPHADLTWTFNNAAASIDADGILTANEVASDTTGTVGCAFTDGGVSVSGNRNVTVVNIANVASARFGARPHTAELDSDFVLGLTGVPSAAGPVHTFNLPLADGNYGYYAHPASWGAMRFEDLDAPGFYGGWDGARNNILNPNMWGPIEVQATVDGVTEAWLVYRTDHRNLGNTRWSMSPQP